MGSKAIPFFSFAFILLLPLLFLAIFAYMKDKKPWPFEFLHHLQGCHKGDKVKDIHKLKKYLENYLNYKNKAHANDDDFDDFLESAIKTYQLNYHLKATGTLDAKTVSKTLSQRCAVADIINGTSEFETVRVVLYVHLGKIKQPKPLDLLILNLKLLGDRPSYNKSHIKEHKKFAHKH